MTLKKLICSPMVTRLLLALVTMFVYTTATAGDPVSPPRSLRTAFYMYQDSVPARSRFREKWDMEHSPLKATVYSAVLPGLGQAYNKKYWKIPIVYAAMGTCVYFIHDNTRQYRRWKEVYINYFDGDPATDPGMDPVPTNLTELVDFYRKWREVSYMSLFGVYILQLIDANVDAHLQYFDVSPNLGLSVHPSIPITGSRSPGIGLTLHF